MQNFVGAAPPRRNAPVPAQTLAGVRNEAGRSSPNSLLLDFGDLRVLCRLSRFEVFDGSLGAEKIRFGGPSPPANPVRTAAGARQEPDSNFSSLSGSEPGGAVLGN